MYNNSSGLIEDAATSQNGHEYYKLGLALILASLLMDKYPLAETYAQKFLDKLLDLQKEDGSWLTDDKDMMTTYPNTETTIIILMAIATYKSQKFTLIYTQRLIPKAVNLAETIIVIVAILIPLIVSLAVMKLLRQRGYP